MELTWKGQNITVTDKVQREGSEELDRFLSQWVASECGQGDQGVTFCGTHRSGLLALFLHERERGEEGREVQVVHAPQVVEGRRVSITPPFLRRDRDAAQILGDFWTTTSAAGDLASMNMGSPDPEGLKRSMAEIDAQPLYGLRRTQSQESLRSPEKVLLELARTQPPGKETIAERVAGRRREKGSRGNP